MSYQNHPRPASSASEASDDYHYNGSKPIKIARTPSIKQVLAEGTLSRSYSGSTPGSMLSSPQLAALPDLTPLPSPIMGHGDGSPGSWNRRGSVRRERRVSKPRSIEFPNMPLPENSVQNGELHAQIVNQKRRHYHGLRLTSEDAQNEEAHPPAQPRPESHDRKGHNRHRSQSDYHVPPMQVGVQRQITVSGSHEPRAIEKELAASELHPDTHMRREPHLAHKRGIEPVKPPTPPSSRTSRKEEDDGESDIDASSLISDERAAARALRRSRHTYFDAYTVVDNKRRRWRALKPLGEGTFSKVILATSQLDDSPSTSPTREEDDHRKLVAVKICEHGPKGGASEERIRLQLKRELELMKNLHHPSLIDLKAFNEEETRMVLVLGYCAGGDLFDIATGHADSLTPSLIKRMFAEMVLGIKFLHDRDIVHRDIKLENILVNLPPSELVKPEGYDWSTYPYSVTTITDLGLARQITPGEKLTTRCGSDDYAAPEVIMGQPYDGREVDAWSLGVLMYTLLELRLPFDPLPGAGAAGGRSRTSHRIARVEWRWVKYAGEDGDHEGDFKLFEEKGLTGIREVVEGMLRRSRSRWKMDKLAALEWVQDMIKVEGGIKFREEESASEVTGEDEAMAGNGEDQC